MAANKSEQVSVLLICQSYPPVIGGSEIEAQRVSEALIRRGYRVQVVCAGGDPMPDVLDWIDPKGVPVRIYARRSKGKMRDVIFALRVAGMLVREGKKYQLVYFLMQGLHLAFGLPLARVQRIPIVMKISSSIIVPVLDKSISGRLELRWLREWAQCVMILNDEVRHQLIDRGFPPQKLVWMPNPVDTDEFSPGNDGELAAFRSKFGVKGVSQVVLYCGRLAAIKALPSLLDGFSLVLQRFPEAVLILLGDGPLRTELMDHAKRLGLGTESVRFVGRTDPSEISSWVKIANVFALVSYSEGFSCALTEAMSTGVACVVSDIPANRQLITSGDQGLLVPVDDKNAIATAINRLLEDESLRESMGRSSRKRVLDHYSIDKVAQRYETIIRQAVGQ
jgi:glycosyltransferase involved in cell wall biosynthesis